MRVASHLPNIALAIIALVLIMAVIRSRNLAIEKSAIYMPCQPAEAQMLLEIDVQHPIGFFNTEQIYLKKVDQLPDEFFSNGHYGCGIGSDATQTILCGKVIDFHTATPGKIRLKVSVHCITHALGAQPGTPPLIHDELDQVVTIPAFGTSVQRLGKFTISSNTKPVSQLVLTQRRRGADAESAEKMLSSLKTTSAKFLRRKTATTKRAPAGAYDSGAAGLFSRAGARLRRE